LHTENAEPLEAKALLDNAACVQYNPNVILGAERLNPERKKPALNRGQKTADRARRTEVVITLPGHQAGLTKTRIAPADTLIC
jgi:hypothetical protein